MSRLSTFSRDFSSENTGPVLINFHLQPPGKRGGGVGGGIYIFVLGHITKWPPCPCLIKF